jgi:rubrerythrin
MIGSSKEIIKSKEEEIKRITDESKKSEKVIIKEYPKADDCGIFRCPYCGSRQSRPFDTCPNCHKETAKITYSNLKDVTSEIRQDIERTMKKSISELENLQLDLEIKVEDLTKQLTRKDKTFNANQEEWEEKTRKRYNKLVEAHREEYEKLEEKYNKLKKDKTDEQVEAKRIEALNELKTTIEKLTKKLEEVEKVGLFRRIMNKLFNIPARKEAIKEIEEAKILVKHVHVPLQEVKKEESVYYYGSKPNIKVAYNPMYDSTQSYWNCN